MKLKDAHGLTAQLVHFLDGMARPEPAAARTLKGLFGELAEALDCEGLERDAAKARKAAVHCGTVADGAGAAADPLWSWITGTAQALDRVIRGSCDAAEAGYPADPETEAPLCLADDEIMAEFFTRQADQLQDAERTVLALEKGVEPADIPSLMRYFHTLKGEAGLLGLEDMARLAHATEDMLTGEDPAACSERLLLVCDWLQQSLQHRGGGGEEPGPAAELIAALAAPAATSAAAPVGGAATWEAVGLDEGLFELDQRRGDVELLQEFIGESAEHLDEAEAQLLVLESEPTQLDALNAVFRAFHTIKGVAGFVEMTHIQNLAHKAENLLDLARKGELTLQGEAMDLTFESIDMLKKLGEDIVAALDGDGRLRKRESLPGLLGRLIRRAVEKDAAAAMPPPAPEAAAPTGDGARSGFIALKKPAPQPAAAAPAPTPAPEAPKAAAAPGGKIQRREAVRVDADRLDLLVETIGELVIAEAMVSQSGELRGSASVETARNLDHLDKICRELQEIGMSLRMVPVRPIFQKMARLARDLSKKVDRPIEFEMSGEDTELDKSVVDKIGDPLVHMIRNAVDHGIESDPSVRIAAGKPAAGHIRLNAYHKGGNIVIEVVDDGRGLDRERILAKAVERGLIKEGQVLSDRETFNLIFEPGFSTAKKVTDVSGRGVGMDVVRRNVEELRGSVEIESELGRGSVFRFKLPLTLAIIDGMVIRTGRENYIIPTLSVVRLVRPAAADYATVRGKGEMLRFEDDLVPLVRLNRVFDVPDGREKLSETVVVVVESEGRRVGLISDDLIGQRQIVIKSLGEKVQGTPGLAGGAIMSDGHVALILDVPGLVKVAQNRKAGPERESRAG